MFEGQAEAAIELYTSLFPDAEVERLVRYGEGEAGPPGTIYQAVFVLNGQRIMAIDSPMPHGFTFTPAMSLFVTCETEAEVDRLFAALSEGGQVLMPLDNYPFSPRFGWTNDRFGVSWQVMLQG
jgi:predicted 3-demethylubiquinone-9 3-methyltransferase (glyoxalase superfamily)